MALTGIEIFKLLPKTNCKECGVPTCLAFAMNLASGKAELDSCPYVSDEARENFRRLQHLQSVPFQWEKVFGPLKQAERRCFIVMKRPLITRQQLPV